MEGELDNRNRDYSGWHRWKQTFVVLSLCLLSPVPALAKIDNPQKIGIAAVEKGSKGSALSTIKKLGFSWYYNWTNRALSGPAFADMPVVPMIWDEQTVSSSVSSPTGALLTFNEPDLSSQANLTVSQALALWPQLMSKGLRLGSPGTGGSATASTGWLSQFMSQAATKNYRVDFIAVHFYSGNGDVNAFKSYLEAIYAKYQKPIWVTEWALIDWGNLNRYTLQDSANYARKALEMLDDLPFVERHSWFSAEYVLSNNVAHTELFDTNKQLTAVGQVFAEALNQVDNPGFEDGLTGWTNLGNTAVVTTDVNSGADALRIGYGGGGVSQDVTSAVKVGRTYTVQASAKLASAKSSGRIVVRALNSSGDIISRIPVEVTSTTYSRYSLSFQVPSGTSNVVVFLWADIGGDYVYFDDVILMGR